MNVVTYDGTLHPKEKCCKIKNNYYLIGDVNIEETSENICYQIGDKYYRLISGNVIFDHRLKKHVLKTTIQVDRGVIGFDESYNPIFGSFSLDPDFKEEDAVYFNLEGVNFMCINEFILEDLVKDNIIIEELKSGIFFKRVDLPIKKFQEIVECNKNYKKSLDYTCDNKIKEFSKLFKDNYSPKEFNKTLANYPQLAGSYSFGLEFETTKGHVPLRICKKLGLIPVRDGSVQGLEYVTIPHSGKKGVQALIDSLEELNKRTIFDNSCSIHFHIGNIPRTPSFFTALTRFLCYIQDEMYSYFPFYTRGGYNLKKKDYTAPLPAINLLNNMPSVMDTDSKILEGFETVFEFLSMGYSFESDYNSDINEVKAHPSDPRGTSKWNIRSRYKWVNMIPLLFGNKKTIEFRIHTSTFDVNKILSYLILCFSIVDFVVKNEKEINENTINLVNHTSFNNILDLYLRQFGEKYTDLSYSISRYFKRRKQFQTSRFLKGDFYAHEDNFDSYPYTFVSNKNQNSFSIKSSLERAVTHLRDEVIRNEVIRGEFPDNLDIGGVIRR